MAAFDMSTSYTRLYSAFYDRYISPAVFQVLEDDLHGAFVDRVGPGAQVLDIGCGGGQHAIAMARQCPDARIVGLDLSPELVRRARRRAAGAGLGARRVEFVDGDALELPYDDAAFDHVYSAGSIKHWSDMRKGLAECVRVLKPGGQLLVMEADLGCRYDDVKRWTAETRLPKLLHPVLHIYFRTYVTGQSIGLDDASKLWDELPLDGKNGPRRISGWPALVMTGVKPAT